MILKRSNSRHFIYGIWVSWTVMDLSLVPPISIRCLRYIFWRFHNYRLYPQKNKNGNTDNNGKINVFSNGERTRLTFMVYFPTSYLCLGLFAEVSADLEWNWYGIITPLDAPVNIHDKKRCANDSPIVFSSLLRLFRRKYLVRWAWTKVIGEVTTIGPP